MHGSACQEGEMTGILMRQW